MVCKSDVQDIGSIWKCIIFSFVCMPADVLMPVCTFIVCNLHMAHLGSMTCMVLQID